MKKLNKKCNSLAEPGMLSKHVAMVMNSHDPINRSAAVGITTSCAPGSYLQKALCSRSKTLRRDARVETLHFPLMDPGVGFAREESCIYQLLLGVTLCKQEPLLSNCIVGLK